MIAGRRALAALLIAAALPGVARGEWREHYNRGREAFAAGRYAEAVEALQAALAERSDERPGGGLLSGRRYTPRYYLGAALAELGRCREALAHFADAEAQGAIQKTPDHADLLRRRHACEERLRRLETARRTARAAVEEMEQAARGLAALRRMPALAEAWEQGEPSLAQLEDQAARQARQARQRLAAGEAGDDLAALAAAAEQAQRAAIAYRDAADEARSRRQAIDQATASALETLEATEASAHRALRSVADLAPYPPRLGARVAALERLLERVVATKGSARPAELAALTDELKKAMASLAAASRRPPEPLIDAVEHYLAGDYEGVFEALAERPFKDPRARAHSCLLRAAAAYAMVQLDGAQEERGAATRLARALDDCRALRSPPAPDRRFFSPRFIAFFDRALTAPAGGTGAASQGGDS
ncbi:MAG: hypothetical protein D6696_03750 [Acidobacteria bacterium]|nr:MAG: hypothetical protein D6696_03750 [Acidobacteriota bacterium]